MAQSSESTQEENGDTEVFRLEFRVWGFRGLEFRNLGMQGFRDLGIWGSGNDLVFRDLGFRV